MLQHSWLAVQPAKPITPPMWGRSLSSKNKKVFQQSNSWLRLPKIGKLNSEKNKHCKKRL